MLACYPRRHNNHFTHPTHLPSSTSPHLDYNTNAYPFNATSSSEVIDTTASTYFDQLATFSGSNLDAQQPGASQYMSNNFVNNDQSPAIRIQQSTPVPNSSATFNNNYNQSGWSAFPESDGQMASKQSLQTQFLNRRTQPHRRAPSSSSVASSGPASPYSQGHATSIPYNISAENSPSTKVDSAFEDNSRAYQNHLPTPTQTPTQDSFLSPSYPNFHTQQNPAYQQALEAHLAMNQAMENNVDDELPGISHSSRHSVSSYGQDPATPHDVYDDIKGYSSTDTLRQTVPKFERTMTDAFADTGYDPTSMPSITTSNASKHSHPATFLSPTYRTVTERLQAAQNARSQSPNSAMNRGVSPFRQGSPLAPTSNHHFGRVKAETAKEARDRQSAQANAMALRRPNEQQEEAPKTISPKDVELEYHESEEDAKMPLFADGASDDFDQTYTSSTNGYRTNPQIGNINYGAVATSRNNNWSANAQQVSYSPSSTAPQSSFTFQAPSIPASMHPTQFTQNYRNQSAMTSAQDEIPEFPAHLTSMESSASEAPASSNNSNNNIEIQKPASALADSGTYTCTYHGCSQRFETPQKLQRHKREAHRQNGPTTPGIGSSMTSAALLARNSQAGPHKCERINPTTGKPCNTIFSRPYDLTRHEDTIHNARKQKVRCALCVEDKTFSRNDALTRHMRVVHPEVDFPGKHRRRGDN